MEYTGEDDSYGLYFQLDHGNGVKSFYAHCSKVEVVKGQRVSMGDTVARIGSTGSSTESPRRGHRRGWLFLWGLLHYRLLRLPLNLRNGWYRSGTISSLLFPLIWTLKRRCPIWESH